MIYNPASQARKQKLAAQERHLLKRNTMDEIRKEVANQINYLGDSEYQLGCQRAETKTVASIVSAIEEHRKQFEGGRVASLMSAIFSSDDNWKKIAGEAEKAARELLLGSSEELIELNELERRATEARRLADEKNRALEAAFNEWSALPERVEKIRRKLADINRELETLTPEVVERRFKEEYVKVTRGAMRDELGLSLIAGIAATRQWRTDVLNRAAEDLTKELAGLRKRSKELSKRLGRKQDI
jgi:predicted  nucleic acid-binding Zn-ribbon protein